MLKKRTQGLTVTSAHCSYCLPIKSLKTTCVRSLEVGHPPQAHARSFDKRNSDHVLTLFVRELSAVRVQVQDFRCSFLLTKSARSCFFCCVSKKTRVVSLSGVVALSVFHPASPFRWIPMNFETRVAARPTSHQKETWNFLLCPSWSSVTTCASSSCLDEQLVDDVEKARGGDCVFGARHLRA